MQNMSESNEIVFPNEYFQGNQYYFQSGNQRNICDLEIEESGYKKIGDFNQQEGDIDSSAELSHLGLTLTKTSSFLTLLEMSLSKGCKTNNVSAQENQGSSYDMPITKMDDFGYQSEKLKAANFPASFIKIGEWQRVSMHEEDLVAKVYYAKKKMVWEVLDGALKSKIEILWSDIIAIRATTPDNEPGILEIELNQSPLFYRETNPQPRKHTLWQQASDFTGGQAPNCRRHYVIFPAGILDKHYEKLLQCDQRLCELSQKPFPSKKSPYFDSTMFGTSINFNRYASEFIPHMQYPYQTYLSTPMENFLQGPSYVTSMTKTNNVYGPQSYLFNNNIGVLNDIDASQGICSNGEGPGLPDKVDSLLEPMDFQVMDSGQVVHNVANYNSGLSNIDSTSINWLFPEMVNESIQTDPTYNNLIPSFVLPNDPTYPTFFQL